VGALRKPLTFAIAGCCGCLLLAPSASAVKHSRWLDHVQITEYWPAPESWGVGRKVAVPGLDERLRVDFLYSAWGMSMEGNGLSEDGHRYHIDSIGSQGWVNAKGRRTKPGSTGWTRGAPYWRDVGWRNRHREVTFPLAGGGWSNHHPVKYIPPTGISFASGPSLDLRFWRSVAVDPEVIPLGSWVWLPEYRHEKGGGWMKAQDTGGAISGHDIDVYREPPSDPNGGNYYSSARIYVVPPGEHRPDGRPPRPHHH
jgi:3D (Asp-Asp-Asp) domain-containing protein